MRGLVSSISHCLKKYVDTFEKKKTNYFFFFFYGMEDYNQHRNHKFGDVHSEQDKYEEGNSFVTVYIRMFI